MTLLNPDDQVNEIFKGNINTQCRRMRVNNINEFLKSAKSQTCDGATIIRVRSIVFVVSCELAQRILIMQIYGRAVVSNLSQVRLPARQRLRSAALRRARGSSTWLDCLQCIVE